MKLNNNASPIDELWPIENLEHVQRCPYCNSCESKSAYSNVQDWSFYCAPGKWNYWDCEKCGSLYLDPRPTQQSIGAAYSIYYTHKQNFLMHFIIGARTRLRNLLYYAWYGLSINPRYKIPKIICNLLSFIDKRRVAEPFVQLGLRSIPTGVVIDVGCGNGANLDFAAQLGWKTFGVEIDPNAAIEAKKRGHTVIVGSYLALREVKEKFDCVICSHVLEHVSDPLELIDLVASVMKPKGTFLLQLPNASSIVRSVFGSSWRGLEAPRHLSIPSFKSLCETLEKKGFEIVANGVPGTESLIESMRIESARNNVSFSSIKRQCPISPLSEINPKCMDTTKLICILKDT